jgi:uncharacterized protein (TIGR00156 family)
MKIPVIIVSLILLNTGLVNAQFTGPVADRSELTVEKAAEARVGTYATVTGNIINQLGEDYYTFQDDTGEIRVEISPEMWRNQAVNPETLVRMQVEVDTNIFGRRYLWVESIEILEED